MNEAELKAFLNLLMSSDPTPLTQEEDDILTGFANAESQTHGFNDWIEAFHKIGRNDG